MAKKTDPRVEALTRKLEQQSKAHKKAEYRLRRAFARWVKLGRQRDRTIARLGVVMDQVEKDAQIMAECKRLEREHRLNGATEGLPAEFEGWTIPPAADQESQR